MGIENLTPAEGSTSSRKRVGRGQGSGMGKTSTRGGKGQTARSGSSRKRNFEGGQTPAHMRLPKRGFTNTLRKEIVAVNIQDILNLVVSKKLDGSTIITKDNLETVGLIKSKKSKVKLIMGKDAELKATVKIAVDSYSAKAKAFSS